MRASSSVPSPGLSGGPTLCAALAELETSLPKDDPFGGAAALAFARAIRSASEYRLKHLGHAAGESCTSHISVVDGDGTMVALTTYAAVALPARRWLCRR